MSEDIPFPSLRILIFIRVEFIIFRKRSTKKTVVTIHFLLGCRISKINKKKKRKEKNQFAPKYFGCCYLFKGEQSKSGQNLRLRKEKKGGGEERRFLTCECVGIQYPLLVNSRIAKTWQWSGHFSWVGLKNELFAIWLARQPSLKLRRQRGVGWVIPLGSLHSSDSLDIGHSCGPWRTDGPGWERRGSHGWDLVAARVPLSFRMTPSHMALENNKEGIVFRGFPCLLL